MTLITRSISIYKRATQIVVPFCFILTGLSAQEEAESSDDVFEFSPFVVSGDSDGYLASSTMAGSRMKTSLKDVSSPVTVLTADFLDDIDATDINEALRFVPSVDDDNRGYNSLVNNPVSTRVRGFTQVFQSQNFFDSRVATDVYNTERIEVNRGPNAILFGVGAPGGLFTATTKNASFSENFGSSQSRFDTFDSWRFSVDYNQVLIDDKLAVRVAGMKQDKRGPLDPMSNDEERFYLALSSNIVDLENYDLRARYQFEYVNQSNNLGSFFTPVDFVTAWQDAGSPTYSSPDEVPAEERWPDGMQGVWSGSQLTPIMTGANEFSRMIALGNRPMAVQTKISTGQGTRLATPISHPVIPGTDTPIPLDINYQGPRFGTTVDAVTHTLFVEQTFFDKLHTELSYFYQEPDREWDRTNGGQWIFADVLEYFPDGSSNPNVGKLFTEGVIRVQDQHREIEVARLTAGYEWDFRESREWLGRHNLGLLLESSRSLLGLNDYVEVNMASQAHAANLTAGGNRIWRRNYLFNGNGDVFDPSASPGASSYSPLSGTVDNGSVKDPGTQFQTDLANFRIAGSETEIDSWVLSIQSFFLNNRVVTFAGVRGDDLVTNTLDLGAANAVRDRGIYPSWDNFPLVSGGGASLNDETVTWGVIGRILPNVGLFYNSSEVLALGDSRPDLFGNPNPISTGEGWDAGARFELLDGKLVGTITVFDTSQVNVPIYNTLGGQNGSNFNTFLDGLIELQALGSVPDLDYDSRKVTAVLPIDTHDNTANGLEFDITYNPTDNWRIAFKAAKQENTQSNVIEDSVRFANEFIYPLRGQLDGDLVLPTTNNTVDKFFSDLDAEVVREKFSREGVITPRLPEWQWNVVTNYRFTGGALQGFSTGGYIRYVGEKPATALLNADRSFTGEYVYGDERITLGLNIGYRKKISDKITMKLRLNVDNVFDNNDRDLQQANPLTGEIMWNRWTKGRTASLTAGFEF